MERPWFESQPHRVLLRTAWDGLLQSRLGIGVLTRPSGLPRIEYDTTPGGPGQERNEVPGVVGSLEYQRGGEEYRCPDERVCEDGVVLSAPESRRESVFHAVGWFREEK